MSNDPDTTLPPLPEPAAGPDDDAVLAEAQVIDRSAHTISRRRIPENVLKVLYRLHRSGYRAYLCGGARADLPRGANAQELQPRTPTPPPHDRPPPLNPRP